MESPVDRGRQSGDLNEETIDDGPSFSGDAPIAPFAHIVTDRIQGATI